MIVFHCFRYALVHPGAINCPNPDGTTYNRVKLLQQQGYHVEIVGQPITDVSFLRGEIIICNNSIFFGSHLIRI